MVTSIKTLGLLITAWWRCALGLPVAAQRHRRWDAEDCAAARASV